MKALWAFDLDGTLVTSNIDYSYVLLDFCRLMLETFEHKAPYYQAILDLEQGIDRERFKTMRAHRDRFPGSLVEAYKELCRRADVAVDSEIEQQVWKIGAGALSEETYQNRSMIPKAEEVLRFIRSQGDLLYCITAGDPVVQWMKWRGYNLGRFFPTQQEFRPVKWDKLPTLKELRVLHSDLTAIMVGDSIGSDMVPASQVGYLPVYVPHPSVWDHGELVEDLPPRTRKFRRIAQVVENYKDLVKPIS